MLSEKVFGGDGDQADAVKVAIIVADGPANRDERRTIPNAEVGDVSCCFEYTNNKYHMETT